MNVTLARELTMNVTLARELTMSATLARELTMSATIGNGAPDRDCIYKGTYCTTRV